MVNHIKKIKFDAELIDCLKLNVASEKALTNANR